jgi:hypothetical protein
MENNGLKNSLDMLMSGLNGLTKNLESTVTDAFKGMGSKEAQQFAKAMKDNNVAEKIEEIKKSLPELNNNMKFE